MIYKYAIKSPCPSVHTNSALYKQFSVQIKSEKLLIRLLFIYSLFNDEELELPKETFVA